MWIESVDVRGFKHLVGELTFTPGLTVVTGPNEAGKSTVHELLVRILFGYSASERRKRHGVSLKDEARPWDARRPFAANATIQDVRGRSMTVEWDFDAHEPTLRDGSTGEDESAPVRGRREDVRLGKHLLDIGLDEFREVCCLHQAAVSAVAHSEDLVLVLQRSVEAGSRDIGVEDADGRLGEFLRGRLGVHSGHYGSLAKGLLARREEQLNQARARLDAVDADRASIESSAATVERLRAERRDVAEHLDLARQQLLLTDLEKLQAKFSYAEELRSRQGQRPANPLQLPQPTVDKVRTGFEQLEQGRERLKRLQREADTGRPELERIADQQRQRQEEADALALYDGIDSREQDHVRDVMARLQALPAQQAEPTGDEQVRRDPQLARYREERERLVALSRRSAKAGWDSTRLVAGLILGLVSSAVGVLVHPLGFIGLLAAAVLIATARSVAQPGDDELGDALRGYGAHSLDELEQRVAAEDQRAARAEGILRERARRDEKDRAELVQLEAELRAALDSVGARPRDRLDERASAYLEACHKHRQLLDAQADVRSLEASRLTKDQPARDLAAAVSERKVREHELGEALRALGIEADNLESARECFNALEQRSRTEKEQEQAAEVAAGELKALLGAETLELLEGRIEKAEQRYREHVARHGRLASEAGDSGELTTRVEGLATDQQDLDLDLREKEAAIATREAALPEPAVLREQIAELDGEIEHMEIARDGIRVAREALSAAAEQAHREFAPHLNAALERNLGRITAGRYEDATVDEGLGIRVRAPETGKARASRSAEPRHAGPDLSRGAPRDRKAA